MNQRKRSLKLICQIYRYLRLSARWDVEIYEQRVVAAMIHDEYKMEVDSFHLCEGEGK